MKILNYNVYLDGGTISIDTDQGTYCLDNRIHSTTKGKLFKGYPNSDDINMIEDSKLIKKELLKCLIDYRDSFYQSSIDNLIKKLNS